MSDPFDLAGTVALVTGASRGIGAAIARLLAENGAKVVLASRRQDGLDTIAAQIAAAGGAAFAHACHVGKPQEVTALVGAAIDYFGKIDVLVNNAGTNPYFGPMIDTEWRAWDKTFEVNLKGYFAATQGVVAHLRERGAPGSIINIASVAGMNASPLQGVYGATKAAVISMTQTLAMELGPNGIRVNAIAPGLIRTRLSSALVDTDAIRDAVVGRTPLGRIGEPEEIAGAALYLASDAAAFLTGQTLVIDGGLSLGGFG